MTVGETGSCLENQRELPAVRSCGDDSGGCSILYDEPSFGIVV